MRFVENRDGFLETAEDAPPAIIDAPASMIEGVDDKLLVLSVLMIIIIIIFIGTRPGVGK